MKIDWHQLTLQDEAGMQNTMQACHKVLHQKTQRLTLNQRETIKQYVQMELKRIGKIYLLFLLALLIFVVFSPYISKHMVEFYYLLLGSYFLYQLYEFKGNAMEELLATLPFHEGKRFILHMCTFLIIHLICFLSFSVIGYVNGDLHMTQVIQLAIVPLFLSQTVMLLCMKQIHTLTSALFMYCALFLAISKLFMRYPNAELVGMVILLSLACCGFLFAAYRHELQLRKEIGYDA